MILTENRKRILILSISGLIATILGVLLLMLVLASIFPERFEAMGITMFHNRESGVFADCFSSGGADIPACKLKLQRELSHRLLGAPPNAKEIRRPRIIPFTFD